MLEDNICKDILAATLTPSKT